MNESGWSSDELHRYAQQIKLSELGLIGQEKLKKARVLCVGLGGLGSPLVLYLAASGIGTLGLMDNDSIALSNLQRQILYRTNDVGRLKTEVAAKEAMALNPAIDVHTYSERLTQDNAVHLLNNYDVLVDATDNFYAHYLLHDTCFKLNKPYIYASVSQFRGYCSVFDGDGPCLRCLFPKPAEILDASSCEEGGVIGVLPGLLGIIQATEVIKSVLQIGERLNKRLLVLDLLNMSFKSIQLVKNPECDLCVLGKDLSDLSYPSNSEADVSAYAISVEQLARLKENPKVSIIDVRTAEEHQAHHLGGKSIPLGELSLRLDELDKEQTIIVYCSSGKRSRHALCLLRDRGFSHLRYVDPCIE